MKPPPSAQNGVSGALRYRGQLEHARRGSFCSPLAGGPGGPCFRRTQTECCGLPFHGATASRPAAGGGGRAAAAGGDAGQAGRNPRAGAGAPHSGVCAGGGASHPHHQPGRVGPRGGEGGCAIWVLACWGRNYFSAAAGTAGCQVALNSPACLLPLPLPCTLLCLCRRGTSLWC